jgi:hypothetical protein
MSTQEAIVSIVVVAMVIGVPFLGLTLRFALKPMVEAWIRVRESQHTSAEVQILRDRVAHLERVLELNGLMDRRASTLIQPVSTEPRPNGLVDRERV